MHKKKYKYHLDKTVKKFICPACRQKRFVRYIDHDTGAYMPDEYGRCDRQESCGYHRWPIPERTETRAKNPTRRPAQSFKPEAKERQYVPPEILPRFAADYSDNSFITGLIKYFPVDKVRQAIELYCIGTYKQYCLFPYIDQKGRIHAIQAKLFDDELHTTRGGNQWLHSLIKERWTEVYNQSPRKVETLFGAHLLKQYPEHSPTVVESTKAAIVAALYYGLPDERKTLWLAAGSLSWLKLERLKCLAGRQVVLMPDESPGDKAYYQWRKVAQQHDEQYGGETLTVGLPGIDATEEGKAAGVDVADLILEYYIPEDRAEAERAYNRIE